MRQCCVAVSQTAEGRLPHVTTRSGKGNTVQNQVTLLGQAAVSPAAVTCCPQRTYIVFARRQDRTSVTLA